MKTYRLICCVTAGAALIAPIRVPGQEPPTPSIAGSAATCNWDAPSATVIPQFLARTSDAYVFSVVSQASCQVRVQVTSSFAPAVEGTLRYAWHDANGDGLLTADEVSVEAASEASPQAGAMLDQVGRQFVTQALGNTGNLLRLNRVQTTPTEDGYEVVLTPGGQDGVFHSLGIAEMQLNLSRDYRVTEMRVRTTQGVQAVAQVQHRDIDGRWFPTGFTRRTSLPDGGLLAENGASSHVLVEGLPLTSSLTVQTTALSPSGETIATMNQRFSFEDWTVVRRSRPLGEPQMNPTAQGTPAGRLSCLETGEVRTRRESPDPVIATQPVSQLRSGVPRMEKYVTPEATFVLYKPEGWPVAEGGQPGFRTLSITDPESQREVAMFYGKNPAGDDVPALAQLFIQAISQQFPDFEIKTAMVSADHTRVVFDARFTVPGKGGRDCRCWVSGNRGEFVYSSIESPEGQLASNRQLLLTILSNVRIMKGAFDTGGVEPIPVQLTPYRLRDGSARFAMPEGWSCTELGKGGFLAADPTGAFAFVVANVEVISPDVGVSVPGVPVSRYRSPSRALQFLTESQGLATNMEFEQVFSRADVAGEMARVYTAGTVEAEEFVYTCDTRNGRCKGYTFGFCFGSRLGIGWNFWHLTVIAPVDRFDAFLGNFASMLESYQIDQGWAANYVAQGTARLRQMEQQTAAMVASNARDIPRMMQAAYDERQVTMDYIDYQRTNYIRGEQDWISNMEGGTVYHADTWGTRNNTTGEYWEGAPYDYVNFEGRNPKYNEQMTSIDSRRLYEQFIRGGR